MPSRTTQPSRKTHLSKRQKLAMVQAEWEKKKLDATKLDATKRVQQNKSDTKTKAQKFAEVKAQWKNSANYDKEERDWEGQDTLAIANRYVSTPTKAASIWTTFFLWGLAAFVVMFGFKSLSTQFGTTPEPISCVKSNKLTETSAIHELVTIFKSLSNQLETTSEPIASAKPVDQADTSGLDELITIFKSLSTQYGTTSDTISSVKPHTQAEPSGFNEFITTSIVEVKGWFVQGADVLISYMKSSHVVA